MPGAEVDHGTRFTLERHSAVLDDDLRPVDARVPGRWGGSLDADTCRSATTRIRRRRATTFVTVDGVRWALTGDAATVDADGTVVLLGRGSMSINTGGEKVYPEEVEAVVKDHPSVYDAVVVGAPARPLGRTGRGRRRARVPARP